MNFNTILDQIASKTGNWADSTLRAVALADLQLVQDELEKASDLPWFLYREQSITIAATTTATNLPTGFIRFDSEFSYLKQTVDNRAKFVIPLPMEKFVEYAAWANSTADRIVAYALTSTQLLSAPALVSDVDLSIYAAFKDSTIPSDAASTNLWATHAPQVLIYETAARVAGEHLQDYDLAARLNMRAQAAWTVLKTHSDAYKYSHLDWVMGGE